MIGGDLLSNFGLNLLPVVILGLSQFPLLTHFG